VVFRASTPQTTVDLTPRYRTDFFPGDEDDETDSLSLRFALSHRTDKSKFSLDANYIDDEILWGFLPTAQVSDVLGNPTRGEDIDTSNVVNDRQRFDVSPEWSYALTQRWNLDLGVEYIDVDYSIKVEDESVPYSYLNGNAGVSYRLSDKSELIFKGALGRYEPEGDIDTKGYGLTAEWAQRTSDVAQIYFRGGVNRVEIPDAAGDLSWESGFSGGAGVRWKFEVTEVVVDATHYIDPNSTGSVVSRDQLQFRLTRKFAPLFSAYVGARGIQDSGVGGASDFRDRKYATGTIGFDWRFSRQLTLAGYYAYVWREYDNSPSDADANALSLGVVYQPKRR